MGVSVPHRDRTGLVGVSDTDDDGSRARRGAGPGGQERLSRRSPPVSLVPGPPSRYPLFILFYLFPLGAYGPFRINIGLLLGYVASAMACTMESIGDYAMCARISEERHPPMSNTNRAIICEGFGAILAAVFGIGTGITTYAENVALMQITRGSTGWFSDRVF